MTDIQTYGDLKKIIKAISLKQKGEKIGNIAIDTVLGVIPGFGTAKTTYDVIKAAISKPDTKKTNTWLDKLDIDDEMSTIVDDTVENGFIQAMTAAIENEPDNKPLEQDFNMNAKMVNYLKQQYNGRTIAGIKENKMTRKQLKDLVKEIMAEASATGGGVAGASYTPGDGFQTASPFAFKPTKIEKGMRVQKHKKTKH
jgi:hypothetical protein